jgi:hypothetical protein
MPKKNWWEKHEIKVPKEVIEVHIIESERGWGQKLDSRKFFDDRKAAEAFCSDYNKGNTASSTPDWYMVARIV